MLFRIGRECASEAQSIPHWIALNQHETEPARCRALDGSYNVSTALNSTHMIRKYVALGEFLDTLNSSIYSSVTGDIQNVSTDNQSTDNQCSDNMVHLDAVGKISNLLFASDTQTHCST